MRKDVYVRKEDVHIWDLALGNDDIPELIHEMLLAYELEMSEVKDEE